MNGDQTQVICLTSVFLFPPFILYQYLIFYMTVMINLLWLSGCNGETFQLYSPAGNCKVDLRNHTENLSSSYKNPSKNKTLFSYSRAVPQLPKLKGADQSIAKPSSQRLLNKLSSYDVAFELVSPGWWQEVVSSITDNSELLGSNKIIKTPQKPPAEVHQGIEHLAENI